MLNIISLSLPFFSIILAGYLSKNLNLFNQNDGRKIAKFAFFIALPPFMFLNIINSPIKDILDLEFIIRYEICTILIFIFSCFIAKFFLKVKKQDFGIFGLNSSYPNYGYIGVPLSLMAFGKEAAIPIALILVADSIVLLTLTACFNYSEKNEKMFISIIKLFISFLKNPILIAVFAGFTFSLLEINIPEIPNVIFVMLAGAAAPSALFALGITLISKNIYSSFSEIFSIAVIKLIIHPLLVTLLLIEWYFKNTTSNTIWIQTAILSACLPIAANVYSMSEFYQKYVTLTAAAITFTTVVASISVTIFLYLLYDLETYLLFFSKIIY